MVNCTVDPTNRLVFALGAAGPVETLCFLARSSNRYKTNVSCIRSLLQKSSYHLTVDSVCNLRIFTKTVFRSRVRQIVCTVAKSQCKVILQFAVPATRSVPALSFTYAFTAALHSSQCTQHSEIDCRAYIHTIYTSIPSKHISTVSSQTTSHEEHWVQLEADRHYASLDVFCPIQST